MLETVYFDSSFYGLASSLQIHVCVAGYYNRRTVNYDWPCKINHLIVEYILMKTVNSTYV